MSKHKQLNTYLLLLVMFFHLSTAQAQSRSGQGRSPKDMTTGSTDPFSEGLVAWWPFDDETAIDHVSRTRDRILGTGKFMPQGVENGCLRFDGFTTLVQRKAEAVPKLSSNLTFSVWVALGAYPWNWTPILSQQRDFKTGFDFGLDYKRRFGLQLAVGGKWIKCISDKPLGMRRWYHLAATYNPKQGVTLYLDGQPAGRLEVTGQVSFAPDVDLHIGRNHKKMLPVKRVREWAKFPSWWSHDGMLDNVRIHDRALSAMEIQDMYQKEETDQAPNMPARKFPDVSGGLKRFGGYSANLKYYEQWDALWQMAGQPDVVVKFDESPVSMVFWKGTHFSPCWVTENGKWMADQSLETGVWPDKFDDPDYQGAVGCSEHMSDTECRFTFAKIVENNDARVVVHWRYAMTDCNLKFVTYDEVAGQGQWGDEFYTIYPDAVATRYVAGWYPKRRDNADQETIFLSEPGTRPEDNCQLDAVTLVGLQGQSKTYSWEGGFPKFDVDNPVIQMVNLKADYKPYMVLGNNSKLWVFSGEVRKEYSHFPWWNHWPVARTHSDGRYAEAPDRAAHSSLVQTTSSNGMYLYGMTNKPAKTKLALAKSWIAPAKMEVASPGYVSRGYDPRQRAYVLKSSKQGRRLKLTLSGSKQSPVHNPAFVIEGWGQNRAVLSVNGQVMPWGKDVRLGHRYRLDRCDLIIWLKHDSTEETAISLTPVDEPLKRSASRG